MFSSRFGRHRFCIFFLSIKMAIGTLKILCRSHLAAFFSDILAPHETRFSKDPAWGAKMAPKMYFRRFPDLKIDSCEDYWCKPLKFHEKQAIWLQLYDKPGNYAATVCRFLKNRGFCSYCMQNSWASFNETSAGPSFQRCDPHQPCLFTYRSRCWICSKIKATLESSQLSVFVTPDCLKLTSTSLLHRRTRGLVRDSALNPRTCASDFPKHG